MTDAELISSLEYDPSTGYFTWLTTRGSAVSGRLAGAKQKTGYLGIGFGNRHYAAYMRAA